jgi:hypothetical protein
MADSSRIMGRKRMKAIGFSLTGLPGRILDHARGLAVRIVKPPCLELLLKRESE